MGIIKCGAVKNTLLFSLIHDFFKVYLPTQKNSSSHTITAYKSTLNSLLDFVRMQRGVALSVIMVEMIDSKMLSTLFVELEVKGNGISTRNHRFASIRAFHSYVSNIEPITVIHYDEICKIPLKRNIQTK